jgi:AcrR family transcriptional regulator
MNQPPPSIWLRPERSARGPVPEHSRAEIARAAVALADEGGLTAVTMRSVAAAIGTGPASLYRYVTTRDEILELMADEAAGEYQFAPPPPPSQPQQPLAGLLELAHQARHIFRRHPWLLDLPAAGGLPGPNAIDFTEHVLAVLDGTPLTSAARLELVGIFTGLVRLLTRTEADLRRAGQQLAQWQDALAGYLASAVTDGRRPHLTAALASALAGTSTEQTEVPPAADDPFDQTLTRLLTGLLVS